MSDNVESMMYHGKRPWHTLGKPLDHPATAKDGLTDAGLDWSVRLTLCYAEGNLLIAGKRAVVRTDRQLALGVVGTRYRPIQNVDAFGFFDAIVGEGKAIYETAGSLNDGRRIWMLARVPGDIWVADEDNVKKYLLLCNSHDGGSPLRALFTPIRVVCENTLRSALAGNSSKGISIRHVGDVMTRVQEAQRVLGISLKYFDDFEDQARALVGKSVKKAMLKSYFAEVLPDPKGSEKDPRKAGRARQTRKELLHLFEYGKGNNLKSVRGTLWAAVNSVAEFVDHERSTRVSRSSKQKFKRFESAQFGSGAALKDLAWKKALALLS